MRNKKKDVMELRFYEVPQDEHVLALLGEKWVRNYGHDEKNLHFHNLMEIGYCRNGLGRLILNEEVLEYGSAMVSVIPQNYPHTTISKENAGPSFWEYLFFDPMIIIMELYPNDPLLQREIFQQMNQKAYFLNEWENRNLALLVKTIMEEMRTKKLHYREYVQNTLRTLVIELIRMCESTKKPSEIKRKANVVQISAALEYIRVEYTNPIKVEDLASICHMSETHFRRVFEAHINMSPIDYINLIRVQRACDIMRRSDDSMDMVAQKAGFATTSTFNRNFKKFLNTSPYQWKINPENIEKKLLDYNVSVLKGW